MEKIELSNMYGRFGKKRKRNWKKYIAIIAGILMIDIILVAGLIWGLDREYEVNHQVIENHLKEIGGRK